ncbi:MAG TPA: DNA mismatch repair protein MutS, partial [Candidatus Marinimicrobia bacterium]|nr:DNA mismatch repair protein MutS [Candidatus Neomarinimicrobiota bacterium]
MQGFFLLNKSLNNILPNTLHSTLDHVTSVRPIFEEETMSLDGFTLRNLEVFQSLFTQGTHGTLLDALDETVTAGGGGLLKQWLNQPLTGLSRLNIRQNIVEAFVQKKKS